MNKILPSANGIYSEMQKRNEELKFGMRRNRPSNSDVLSLWSQQVLPRIARQDIHGRLYTDKVISTALFNLRNQPDPILEKMGLPTRQTLPQFLTAQQLLEKVTKALNTLYPDRLPFLSRVPNMRNASEIAYTWKKENPEHVGQGGTRQKNESIFTDGR